MPPPILPRYKPLKTARLFTKNKRYSEIDWNDWKDVVRRFEQQMRWWYVTPITHLRSKSAHNGFAVVALCCVLVDAMSQYEAGVAQSSGAVFKGFVRRRLAHLCTSFPVPIRTWNEKHGSQTSAGDFADVLWSGYRCGKLT